MLRFTLLLVSFFVWVVIFLHYYFIARSSRGPLIEARVASTRERLCAFVHFLLLPILTFTPLADNAYLPLKVVLWLSFLCFVDVLLFGALLKRKVLFFVLFFVCFLPTVLFDFVAVFFCVQFIAVSVVSYVYLLLFYGICLGREKQWAWRCYELLREAFYGYMALTSIFLCAYIGDLWLGFFVLVILFMLMCRDCWGKIRDSPVLVLLQYYILISSGLSLALFLGGHTLLANLLYYALILAYMVPKTSLKIREQG